jgi:hypothetical protein
VNNFVGTWRQVDRICLTPGGILWCEVNHEGSCNEKGKQSMKHKGKPVGANKPQALPTSGGGGKLRAIGSPSVEKLHEQKKNLWNWPTVLELAHLAAKLDPNGGANGGRPNVAQRALELVRLCRETLEVSLDQEIKVAQAEVAAATADETVLPEWCRAFKHEIFPLDFEKGLRLLMGKQTRRTERYKAFRDFARFMLKNDGKSVEQTEAEVEHTITTLKAKGIDEEAFAWAGENWEEWKKLQGKEKAKAAAQKRWRKN